MANGPESLDVAAASIQEVVGNLAPVSSYSCALFNPQRNRLISRYLPASRGINRRERRVCPAIEMGNRTPAGPTRHSSQSPLCPKLCEESSATLPTFGAELGRRPRQRLRDHRVSPQRGENLNRLLSISPTNTYAASGHYLASLENLWSLPQLDRQVAGSEPAGRAGGQGPSIRP